MAYMTCGSARSPTVGGQLACSPQEAMLMDTAILAEILALKNATLEEIRARYMELYGGKEPPNISKTLLHTLFFNAPIAYPCE